MSDYTIYALKNSTIPDQDAKTYKSLREGVGRFGWSYVETADLTELRDRIVNRGWDDLDDDEKACYQTFLLDIKEGDYVVYINIPTWGECTLARVTGPYFWEWGGENSDFNHRFSVDPDSFLVFDRNDAIVHPQLSSKLKLRGRWWRIFDLHEEFELLVDSLKKGEGGQPRTMETSLDRFKNEILPNFESITKKIHRAYPGSDLEKLIAEIFRRVPGVKDVKEQGGPGEHGADLLVIFEWGVLGQSTWVVQVKSFKDEMWETKAVDQIREALEYWGADMGVIVSTASSGSEALDKALDKLRDDTGKPVSLLIGEDVAAFLVRFGGELLS
ncbi:MAG: restriction endonuclease [Bacteroidetes bacterium SB0662_bin_6]|nr:restriction endonuclease [Bacteroidetes bacterium SB0668_bin_1]MYE04657.1 restriction endonuclease [Bacteroidetes bacterium SB0662_bin_6]